MLRALALQMDLCWWWCTVDLGLTTATSKGCQPWPTPIASCFMTSILSPRVERTIDVDLAMVARFKLTA
jgi:hypothetical protein